MCKGRILDRIKALRSFFLIRADTRVGKKRATFKKAQRKKPPPLQKTKRSFEPIYVQTQQAKEGENTGYFGNSLDTTKIFETVLELVEPILMRGPLNAASLEELKDSLKEARNVARAQQSTIDTEEESQLLHKVNERLFESQGKDPLKERREGDQIQIFRAEVPTYEISLDKPPVERFKEVARDFKKEIKMGAAGIATELPEGTLDKIIPLVEIIAPIVAQQNAKMNEAIEELKGISQVTKVPLPLVLAFNFIEEFTTMCTSVVVQTQNGNALLARNLDFDFAPLLSALSFNAVFTRDGKQIFRASMFAGSTSVFTGQRDSCFSIAMNSRPARSPSHMLDSLINLLEGAPKAGIILRNVLAEEKEPRKAVARLRWEPIIGSAYFTLAGADGTGSLIARGQTRFMISDFDKQAPGHITSRTYELKEKSNGATEWITKRVSDRKGWFLAQTNCDAEWAGVDIDDGRFFRVNELMEHLGQFEAEDLQRVREKVLFQEGVVFSESVYNTLMCPATNFYDTIRLFSK